MIKRLIKAIFIIPSILSIIPEVAIWGIRWIVTGRGFPDKPLFARLLDW